MCIKGAAAAPQSCRTARRRGASSPRGGHTIWLFAGNDRAGQTAATLYTLIASAERHGVDPQRYLTSVLARIAITPAAELEPFLPDV
jgi:hypothetical protein